MEILEKLGLLQSTLNAPENVAAGQTHPSQQLQDDVGICLLKLGRSVVTLPQSILIIALTYHCWM